jgi:Tfp pilus assembly protein PilZ
LELSFLPNRTHNDSRKLSLPLIIMDKAFTTTFAPSPTPRKAAARAALVGFSEPHHSLLAECFRQFGIEPVAVNSNPVELLLKEKFEACVLALAKAAESEAVMESARSSRSNSRCVIYGVGGSAQDAMRFSKYGINAMFHEPLERPAMLKLVRATRLLVLHEFRRYVRIPVMTEVSIVGDGRRLTATSIEMSSGGMSLKTVEDFPPGANVEVSFALMTLPRVNVRGVVSWNKPKGVGVRFDPNDERRFKVKTWIDSYLEN